MQIEYNNGLFSEIEKYQQKKMEEALSDPEVKEVHVFKNTPENIRDAVIRREKAIKAKTKGFRKRRRFK